MKTYKKLIEDQDQAKEADDPGIKSEKKKESQLKKRVLMQKLRAVRSGVEGIVAHHEPEGTPIMEEDKAFNFVLNKIRKEVGKDGYVSKNNPRKPQTPQQKAKVRAHQAKVDAENAAERKKDPSQGRYPKG